MSTASEVTRETVTVITPTEPVLMASAVPTISPDSRGKELAMPLKDWVSRAK